MFGDLGLKLVQEARAAEINQTLPPYNDELVRLVMLETRQLQTHISGLLQEAGGVQAAESEEGLAGQLITHHAAAQRNKRCLLAYHNVRLQYLQSIIWSKGGSLELTLNHSIESPARLMAHEADKTTLKSRCSMAELAFVRQYADLNRAYKSEFLDVVDISASLGRSTRADDIGPIKELMVSIVSHVDAKDVQTERGSISLRRGERMRILRSEVDALIMRGWVSVLDE